MNISLNVDEVATVTLSDRRSSLTQIDSGEFKYPDLLLNFSRYDEFITDLQKCEEKGLIKIVSSPELDYSKVDFSIRISSLLFV